MSPYCRYLVDTAENTRQRILENRLHANSVQQGTVVGPQRQRPPWCYLKKGFLVEKFNKRSLFSNAGRGSGTWLSESTSQLDQMCLSLLHDGSETHIPLPKLI